MTILLLGGRSEIGLAVVERLAARGGTVLLAARQPEHLDDEQRRVWAAGATDVVRVAFDADDVEAHASLLPGLAAAHGPLDVVVVAFGVLGDQARAERDPAHALAVVHTDYVAHVSVLTTLATVLRAQRSGRLVVFSSVAGLRVRRANYVYGSAKAGLDGFTGGLSYALEGSGASVLLVRPGFVVGRMTEGMRPAPFASTPGQVADAVAAGLRDGRHVVWVPAVLQPVFAVLRLLPRAVWRRMPR